MKDLVVIIPIHELDDTVKPLLEDAIKSVPEDIEIRISCKNGLSSEIVKEYKKHKNIAIYESENTDSPSDFCSLVNQAVGDSKWFSILEFDDEYTEIWFDNVKKYIEYQPDTSIFLPMEDLVDYRNKEFIGFGNEAPWASSFSNEIGYIDLDCLQNFFDFYLTGGIFNTADWEEMGGLKPSIKVTFWYEFLLRMTNKGKKVFVIPKIGYVHYLRRENSLFEQYRATVDEKESEWWYNLAKKEYFFKEDRKKTYNAEKQEE